MGLFTQKHKRKVTIEEFKQMLSYKSLVKNEEEKQRVKMALVYLVKESYGDKWYRLKDGTKKAVDMLCWFATERGFVFAGDDYLADHYEIAVSTVRNVIKHMEKSGLIHKVYRNSTKHNGLGNRVLLFVNHEYFAYWNDFLSLDYQAECKAEKAETPSKTRDRRTKTIPTINSPQLINTYKIRHAAMDSSFIPTYVPAEFVTVLKPFYEPSTIYNLWGKAMLAGKKVKVSRPLNEYMETVIKAIKQTVFLDKQKKIKQDIYGYFYSTLHGLLYKDESELAKKAGKIPFFYDWVES